ncbi:restriction endonuclease subunit S [Burkholderia cenocepacia]|uniref:restriction endonuclease subunit S n=1 Tax=Burkholderia cenocepacia TaxID=95486 RepID=UPI002B240112|nr:restriction endonuclease subunit S [Burkholderia cenocepacia]MEB2610950.1 restriction endonuclease subunit S [Burkholderia cenocepacia]
MSELGSLLTLEYGEALPAEARSGYGFPVFGSNGEVGRHLNFLIPDAGIVVGRKGSVGKVTWSNSPFWPIDTTYWVRCAPEDKRWLYWMLLWLPLARLDTSTGVPGLNRNDVYALCVDRPRLIERQLIARVLDTLDTAIHETEAIIAKLKAVKQGLLHDLLTRGIAANGELRLPQAEAPHLYKESPLGWIPKEWACKPFGDLCESSAFGPRFPSDAYDENGPLATLRTTDMDEEGNITLSTMPRAAIAPSVFADHLLRPGDIVISRSGTCGVTGVFAGHNIPVVPGAFLIRFRIRDVRLNRFYRRYFNSSLGRPYLERLAVGGVQKNIKGSDVLCLPVPIPSPEEAIAIAERVESIEHDIGSNQQLFIKLTLQKSGLMDDLLTGRVRVTPLLAEAEQQKGSI